MKKFIAALLIICIFLGIAYSESATPTDLDPVNKTITLNTNIYLDGQYLDWASHSVTSEWTPNSLHYVDGYLRTNDICALTMVTINGSSHEVSDWFPISSEDYEDGTVINANFFYCYIDWNHAYNVTVKHVFNDSAYTGDPMTVDKSFTATPGTSIDVPSYSRGHFYFKVSTMPGGAWYLGSFSYTGGEHRSVYGITNNTDYLGVVDTMIHQDIEIIFYYSFYPIADPTASPSPTPSPTPTATPTATPSPTPTATPSPTPTATPSPTPSPTPTVTPIPTPTITPTVTPTITPTVTSTATPAVTPMVTPTVAPTVIPTTIPTVTPVVTPTPTLAPIPTPTVTITPTVKPTPTITPTSTLIPTSTPIVTVEPTPTVAPTVTPVLTEKPSEAPTVTHAPTKRIISWEEFRTYGTPLGLGFLCNQVGDCFE